MNIKDMYKAHAFTNDNMWMLQEPQTCRCIYCLETFESRDITDYTMDDTAVCPYCGVDAVIGEASGYHFTNDEAIMMYEVFFNTFTDGISEHIRDLSLLEKHRQLL